MALERELAFFTQKRDELLKNHKDKFALVKGEALIGVYDSASNAYKVGVSKFGREAFLVKPIREQDETYENQALALGLIYASI